MNNLCPNCGTETTVETDGWGGYEVFDCSCTDGLIATKIMNRCTVCNTPIHWLRMKPTMANPHPKANPVEVVKVKDGNLVVDLERGFYHFATKEEKESSQTLWRSHFSSCPKAAKFRRKK